jgi:hypothetical protein
VAGVLGWDAMRMEREIAAFDAEVARLFAVEG